MRNLLIIAGVLCALTASAQLPESKCVRAIVGEASSEPYETQVAIGAVIRNRGSLQGVYGVRAPHVKHESKATFNKAAKAWAESAKRDPTKGCKYWGGPMDDPYFKSLGKSPLLVLGTTRFYK